MFVKAYLALLYIDSVHVRNKGESIPCWILLTIHENLAVKNNAMQENVLRI